MSAILGEVERSETPVVVEGLDFHLGPFVDLTDLLEFLHTRWMTSFGVAMDTELESSDDDVAQSVDRVWHDLAVRERALHAVLSAYSGHPAVATAQIRHELLLESAGLTVTLPEWANPAPEW
jgi:hypothetical protein